MGSSTYSFFQLFVSSWYKSLRRTRVRIIIFQETGLIMPGGLFLGTQLPFHTWRVHLQFCKGRRFSRPVRRSVCFWRSRIGSRFGVRHCHHRCWPEIQYFFRKERAMSKAGGYSCVIFLKLYKDGRWKDWRIRRKDAHVKCASLSHLFKCGMVLFFPPRPGGHV